MYFDNLQLAMCYTAALTAQMLLYKKNTAAARHKFTPDEDEKLRSLVLKLGDNDWLTIANEMKPRTARQCRERYKNYLAPQLLNGPWTESENTLLEEKYKEFGPRWAKIAQFFPSRSDVNIKNHWASLSNKLRSNKPVEMTNQSINAINPSSSFCSSNFVQNGFASPQSPISPPSPPTNNFTQQYTPQVQIIENTAPIDQQASFDYNDSFDFAFDDGEIISGF